MKTINDKHTPGPWAYSPAVECVFTEKVNDVPQICSLPAWRPDNAANGRLIAAAPDLLAALENIIETAPIDIECEDSVEKYRSFVLRVACAAVAAVQGGAR